VKVVLMVNLIHGRFNSAVQHQPPSRPEHAGTLCKASCWSMRFRFPRRRHIRHACLILNAMPHRLVELPSESRDRIAQAVGALSERQAEPEPSWAAGKMNSPSSRQATARMTSKTRLKARLPAGKESGHAVRHRDTREFESDCERTHGQAVGARSKAASGARAEPGRGLGGACPPLARASSWWSDRAGDDLQRRPRHPFTRLKPRERIQQVVEYRADRRACCSRAWACQRVPLWLGRRSLLFPK